MKILTPQAQQDRENFINADLSACTCNTGHPPCSFCTHPGNPINQDLKYSPDCWMDVHTTDSIRAELNTETRFYLLAIRSICQKGFDAIAKPYLDKNGFHFVVDEEHWCIYDSNMRFMIIDSFDGRHDGRDIEHIELSNIVQFLQISIDGKYTIGMMCENYSSKAKSRS